MANELKNFKDQVDERMKESLALDAKNQREAEALDRQIGPLEKKLADNEALLSKMKNDYSTLEIQRKNDLQKEYQAAAEKLKAESAAGRIDIVKFLAQNGELKKTHDENLLQLKNQLADSLKVIREKDKEILEQTKALWSLKYSFFYLESAPVQVGLKSIEDLLRELSAKHKVAGQAGIHARQKLGEAEGLLQRAAGIQVSVAEKFESLKLAEVQALRFRATIPEVYMTQLEAAISEIEAYEADRLQDGKNPGLYRFVVRYDAARCDWSCNNENSWAVVMHGKGMRQVATGCKSISMTDTKPKVEPGGPIIKLS